MVLWGDCNPWLSCAGWCGGLKPALGFSSWLQARLRLAAGLAACILIPFERGKRPSLPKFFSTAPPYRMCGGNARASPHTAGLWVELMGLRAHPSWALGPGDGAQLELKVPMETLRDQRANHGPELLPQTSPREGRGRDCFQDAPSPH